VITTVYLITTRNGFVRATKRKPTLSRGEVAIELTLTVPDECFRAPIIQTRVEVDPDEVMGVEARAAVARPGRRRLALDAPVS
jgi:hypothetical protein